MKELNNFTEALKELEEYLGITTLTYYGVDINEESFFTVYSNGDIGWADSLVNLEEQDGEYYQEEVLDIRHTDDLTAVLFDGNMGDGRSWIIFNNKNKVKEV